MYAIRSYYVSSRPKLAEISASGDGNTSTEKDPVHIYESGGVYTITLTASNSIGSAEATTQVSLDLTPYELLTGVV